MEETYANLLLNRCVNLNKSKSLVISYEKDNLEFVNLLVAKIQK